LHASKDLLGLQKATFNPSVCSDAFASQIEISSDSIKNRFDSGCQLLYTNVLLKKAFSVTPQEKRHSMVERLGKIC